MWLFEEPEAPLIVIALATIFGFLWKMKTLILQIIVSFMPIAVKSENDYPYMSLLCEWIVRDSFFQNGMRSIGEDDNQIHAPSIAFINWKGRLLIAMSNGGPMTPIQVMFSKSLGLNERMKGGDKESISILFPYGIFWGKDKTVKFFEEMFEEIGVAAPKIVRASYSGPRLIFKEANGQTAMDKPRDPNSVIMHPGIMENISNVIKSFKSVKEERRAKRTGKNRTLCFLLYGEPGTGKNSLTWWIAYQLKARSIVHYDEDRVKKGDYYGNSDTNCVYALHDIDRIVSSAGDSEGQGIVRGDFNLNALLNTLDGSRSQDGSCYVLTCNDLGKIPAAVRSRCHLFYIGYPSNEMLTKALCIYFDSTEFEDKFLAKISEVNKEGNITIRRLHLFLTGISDENEALEKMEELANEAV